MVKKFLIIGLLLALSIALSGCLLADARTGNPLPNSLKMTNLTEALSTNQVCMEVPGPNPCYCMVCENKTDWDILGLRSTLGLWFDTTLKEGNCTIDYCNITAASQIIKENDNKQLRTFMFGNGPSFTAADKANLFCNYSNQLSVTWMKGAGGLPPIVPNSKRAVCWLDRNIIPVYIYYTAGSAVDAARTGQIAFAMKDKGPVMITTEIGFDSADPGTLTAVKQQIYQIKSKCPNCLSVLAVKSGDMDAVKAVLDDPSKQYDGKNISNLTDLVGFGFRANDYPDCNVNRIIGYNLGFSRYLLRNYSKPTIWLYAGASEGSNIDGNCVFSPGGVREFYQSIFTAAQGLASSGVVGASFYEFTDRTGPLPCENGEGCDYGMMLQNGSQKHPEINTWSELCQYYSQEGSRSPLVFSRNAQGSACDALQNWKMYQVASEEVNTDLGLKYTPVVPLDRQKKLNCGEICVSDVLLQKPEIYDSYTGVGSTFSSSHCTEYPQIEDTADDAEISSLYFRGLVQQESGFDPWIVSCNKKQCNYPLGTTMDQICQAAGYAAGCPAHTLNEADKKKCPADMPYFCAFGLAQCIAKPGTLDMSKCGGGSYDPFNPSHSICCGVSELKAHLGSADTFLKNNWPKLSKCTDGMKQDEYDWAKYYLAANRYYGAPSMGDYKIGGITKPLIDWFIEQRDLHGECTGEQNYVKWLRTLTYASLGSMKDSEYGAKQLTIYLDAIPKCGSDCPGATSSLGGIASGETGDMRAFGHSLAVGAFQGSELAVQNTLASRGIHVTVNPTAAQSSSLISYTTANIQKAGHHKSIVIYTGANDDVSQYSAMTAKFDELLAAADAKADKIYIFGMVEYGSSNKWLQIRKLNNYLQGKVPASNGKIVFLDINAYLQSIYPGCGIWHSSDVHGCYSQTRDFFVDKVAASPPPA